MNARTPHPELPVGLALIGGRGCGKSSISKRLARRNRNFMLFSLDALIRYEANGAAIPAIVEERGWSGFRDLEYDVVEKVSCFTSGALLDCGGGVVVDVGDDGSEVYSHRKVDALRRHCKIVYLQRDAEYLERRIASDPNRPSLSDQHSFREIMDRRDAWYRAAADWTLECEDGSKSKLTDKVLTWFYREIGARPSS